MSPLECRFSITLWTHKAFSEPMLWLDVIHGLSATLSVSWQKHLSDGIIILSPVSNLKSTEQIIRSQAGSEACSAEITRNQLQLLLYKCSNFLTLENLNVIKIGFVQKNWMSWIIHQWWNGDNEVMVKTHFKHLPTEVMHSLFKTMNATVQLSTD